MIITDITTLTNFIRVQQDLSLESLNPSQRLARTKYIDRWFSSALVTEILGFAGSANATEAKAYELFMMAYCHFVILEYLPLGEIRISDSGILRTENANAKTAYAGQIERAQESTEDIGYLSTNDLIELMNANTGSFTNWSTSPAYSMNSNLLVKTAREFSDVIKLHRPFATFIAITGNIRVCQDLYIKSWMDSTLFAELVANASGMSAAKKELLEEVKMALCFLTISYSIKERMIELSSEGARLIEHNEDTSKRVQSSARSEQYSAAIKQNEDTGLRYIERAKAIIRADETEFGTQEVKPTRKNFWA